MQLIYHYLYLIVKRNAIYTNRHYNSEDTQIETQYHRIIENIERKETLGNMEIPNTFETSERKLLELFYGNFHNFHSSMIISYILYRTVHITSYILYL